MTWSEKKAKTKNWNLIVPGGDVLPCVTRSKLDGAATKLALLSTNASGVDRAATASFFARRSTGENAALENQQIKNMAKNRSVGPSRRFKLHFCFFFFAL